MSRIRFLLILVVVLIASLAFWLHKRSTAPPVVAFATVQQERLVSTLPTNGKVEPSEWVAVRAERPGVVARVLVQKGQQVANGAVLAEMDARDARAEVSSAEAALSQAQVQVDTLARGGSDAARIEIESELDRTRAELAVAGREHAALQRLAAKQAATGQEVTAAAERVHILEASAAALARKRAALVGPADRAAAEARVRQAAATLEQARAQLERGRIRAPRAGVVFDLAVRQGAYLAVGDPVASVGNLETLRVRIYVDEPELGRVAVGMPVAVTWDALPGRPWTGSVEKLPTEVAPLGTRQVGEVVCTIANPDLKLLPGTNVNVEITSQVVDNGLAIPKEAIRNENGQTGVYVLAGEHVEWRPVRLGVASVTRAIVTSGVSRGDKVALHTDEPLHPGDPVEEARP
jgi:HlyD family secretion protein